MDRLKRAAAIPAATVTPAFAPAVQGQPQQEASTIDRPGSDFMVDVIKLNK
jgi:hypothetical protein